MGILRKHPDIWQVTGFSTSNYMEHSTAWRGTDFTFFAWASAGLTAGNVPIIGIYDRDAPDDYYYFYMDEANASGWRIGISGNASIVSGTGQLAEYGDWEPCCITGSNGDLDIYFSQNDRTRDRGNAGATTAITGSNVVVGLFTTRDSTPTAPQKTEDRLSNMAFWDVKLSASEVTRLLQGESPGKVRAQNLQHWYPFATGINYGREGGIATKVGTVNSAKRTPLYKSKAFDGPRFALADPLPDTRVLNVPKIISWTEQPPVGTPLDFSNPLTKGLVTAIPLLGSGDLLASGGYRDYSRNNYQSVNDGTLSPGIDENGYFVHTAAADSISISNWAIPQNETTVLFAIKLDAVVTSRVRYFGATGDYECASGNTAFTIGTDFYLLSGAGPATVSELLPETSYWSVLTSAIKSDNTRNRVWTRTTNNVIRQTLDASVHAGDTPAATGTFQFGASRGLTDGVPGNLYFIFVWDRQLSVSEEQSVISNPWQIFKPQNLQVPIEYQELTFDSTKEERLFMIPQRARRQPK